MKHIAFIASFFIFISQAQSEPEWVRGINTQKLDGKKLTILCVGDGPSQDLARQSATSSCLSTARRQMITKQKIKSLTVETESSVGYHEEVSEDITVSGLICKPKREAFENDESSFHIWLLCEFNFENAKIIDAIAPDKTQIKQTDSDTVNRNELIQLNVTAGVRKNHDSISTEQNIIVVSVPPCESIIIRGKKPRTHVCKNNPTTLRIYNDDEEAIVRANGYLPKTIKLKTGGRINGPIQIFLDRT